MADGRRRCDSVRLTREEEVALARAAQGGDAAALDRLVTGHRILIESLARAVHRGEPPFEDLVQEGVCGFLAAVARFDVAHPRGARLATFARRWILRDLHRASCAEDRRYGGRVPENAYYAAGRMRRAESEMTARLGRLPTATELAAELGLAPSVARVVEAMRRRRLVALDAPVGTPLDLADTRPGPAERLIEREERDRLHGAIARLPPQMRRALAAGDFHQEALRRLRALLGGRR